MPSRKTALGHLAALLTVIVWGATFIATKHLLNLASAVEILFLRFAVGYALLLVIAPKTFRFYGWKAELLFLSAALSGVTLYFLCENMALTFTQASNVGVIVSIAPIFTAILAQFFLKDEKLTARFFLGFVVALAGIGLIHFSGKIILQLNPVGDLLALLACILWGAYSIIMRKLAPHNVPNLVATRRIFFYGLVTILPLFAFQSFSPDWAALARPVPLASLLFLGVFASALCYVSWNWCMDVLGAIKTSNYIYLIPVVTVVLSHFLLDERITLPSLAGVGLTMLGLFLSEQK